MLTCGVSAQSELIEGAYAADGKILDISANGKGQFKFELTVKSDQCAGSVAGIAIMGADGIALFKSEDCLELSFSQKENSILIAERDCFMHGALCEFEGTYIPRTDPLLDR